MGLKDFIDENIVSFKGKKDKGSNQLESSTSSYPIVSGGTRTSPTTTAPAAGETDKFETYFNDLFNKANLPGPDYFEFSIAVAKMASRGTPVNQAMLNAFDTLQTSGLSKEILIKSINEYLGILDKDEQELKDSLTGEKTKEIENRKQQMVSIDEDNKKKMEMINKLNEEINTNNQNKQKINFELREQEAKLSQAETNYNFALQAKRTKLQSDLQQIQMMAV